MPLFEIRLFGTIHEFGELKLETNHHLIDSSIIEMIGYESIDTDAFSIAYAPEYYVLSYHFSFPNRASMGFKNQRASVSIAIKRGFKLIHPLQTLHSLRDALVEYAQTMRLALPEQIATKSSEVNALVETEISPAPEQAMVNWASDGIIQKALVAFDEEKQLAQLLDNPFRKEFQLGSGRGVIFLMYRKRASALWPKVKDTYQAIIIHNYDASEQLAIEFPDGHNIVVDNRQAAIDYVCHKPYYSPYHFKGVLSEQWEKWRVRFVGNRYLIGLPLNAEERVYQVQFENVGIGESDTPTMAQFTLGVYNKERQILKLMGEENTKPIQIQLGEDKRVVDVKKDGGHIVIQFEKQYVYSTDYIWNSLQQQGITPSGFFIEDDQGERVYSVTKRGNFYIPIPYEKAVLHILETDDFAETISQFDESGHANCIVNRKHFSTIQLDIQPEKVIKRIGRKSTRLRYKEGNSSAEDPSKEVYIDKLPYVLEHISGGLFSYEIESPGYNPVTGETMVYKDKDYTIPIIVCMQPKQLTKLLDAIEKHYITIIAFLIGCFAGYLSAIVFHSPDSQNHNAEKVITADKSTNNSQPLPKRGDKDNIEKQKNSSANNLRSKSISDSTMVKKVNLDKRDAIQKRILMKLDRLAQSERRVLQHSLKDSLEFNTVLEELDISALVELLNDQERREFYRVVRHKYFVIDRFIRHCDTFMEAFIYLEHEERSEKIRKNE